MRAARAAAAAFNAVTIPGMALLYGTAVPPSTAWRDFPQLSICRALKLPQTLVLYPHHVRRLARATGRPPAPLDADRRALCPLVRPRHGGADRAAGPALPVAAVPGPVRAAPRSQARSVCRQPAHRLHLPGCGGQ